MPTPARYLLVGFLFSAIAPQAQNLISNPGFEDVDQSMFAPTVGSTSWHPTTHFNEWHHVLSPDWAHADHTKSEQTPCDFYWGAHPARTGKGFVALHMMRLMDNTTASTPFLYREYIRNSLTDTLKANKLYHLTFWVKLAPWAGIACDGWGAVFTADSNYLPVRGAQPADAYFQPAVFNAIVNNPTLHEKPCSGGYTVKCTSMAGWQQIKVKYIARGGERYVVLGNFRHEAVVSHEDSEIVKQWKANNAACEIPYNGGFGLKTATYMFDDISLVCSEEDTMVSAQATPNPGMLRIFPNPASDKVTLSYSFPDETSIALLLRDMQGRLVRQHHRLPAEGSFSILDLAPGSYVVEVLGRQQRRTELLQIIR